MKPLALIFDLDDTLIESFPGYVRLHQKVAHELGWRVPTVDELRHYGATWEETLFGLWPEKELAPFFELFDKLIETVQYPPIEGVLEALWQLRERGHPQFIVTKRSSRRLGLRMAQAGLRSSWFSGIFTADHGPYPKPDPRCFEPVWSLLGWQPEHGPADARSHRAVYIGDRAEDQLVAVRAGIPFIAVRTGPEVPLGFPAPGAAMTLGSVRELPDALSEWVREMSA